jgi:CheY-like chemotaxis protein
MQDRHLTMKSPSKNPSSQDATSKDLSFKAFHELMAHKVTEILLVCSPYDAFILEEEGRLAERIILEYRGLNLSRPPRIGWVSTAENAFSKLEQKWYDFIITTPRIEDMEVGAFSREIKKRYPDLPIYLLTHYATNKYMEQLARPGLSIDRILVWTGNADLLLAVVKNLEDHWNIADDTALAKVRVIILVEDSPYYFSSILPLLYKEIVTQTQAVMEDSLNEEHRLLRMRARPKIVVAETYEQAEQLYHRYKPYLLSILSDVRFPKNGTVDPDAGVKLLRMIKQDTPWIPLLMLSSEERNREKAYMLEADFINKNSPNLHTLIRSFFIKHLGFGPFIFRMPDGTELARAGSLLEMEKVLAAIPDESIFYHARHNDFSTWLMARSEIKMATRLRPIKATDFSSVAQMRYHLISNIKARRKGRQKGIIIEFSPETYDADTDFAKIGRGSLGGKARGLAFVSTLLKDAGHLQERFPAVDIFIPKTLVISTDGFDAFMAENQLDDVTQTDLADEQINARFVAAKLPPLLVGDLRRYLQYATYPLAVRSSSLLEDAYSQPYAGIYRTYMIPNCDPSLDERVRQLATAVKLVYASTFLETPRSFAQSTLHRTEEEKMAVVVQQLIGDVQGGLFYPCISGVAQSHNYYPVAPMRSEEGVAHIALGLGKTVVEGGNALRFSPRHPQVLPQFSTVEDKLANAQRHFYALKMGPLPEVALADENATLVRIDVDEAVDHPALRYVASYYIPEENRIRDAWSKQGFPVITFARILKHDSFPLAKILRELLKIGQNGMGGPVEMEFCVRLDPSGQRRPQFALLQIRPMSVGGNNQQVHIAQKEIEEALLHTHRALGVSQTSPVTDIVFVKPERFDPAKTRAMAEEISAINSTLARSRRDYLLIGPGRWGSADHWLGIPVNWQNISKVLAIVETSADNINADASQGSHFFHNITSLGIAYLTIRTAKEGAIRWDLLNQLSAVAETEHIRHVRPEQQVILKVDARSSRAVVIPEAAACVIEEQIMRLPRDCRRA